MTTTAAARAARQALGLPNPTPTPEQERAAADRALARMWDAFPEVTDRLAGDARSAWERMCDERSGSAAWAAFVDSGKSAADVHGRTAAADAAANAVAASTTMKPRVISDRAVRAIVCASRLLSEAERADFLDRHLRPIAEGTP